MKKVVWVVLWVTIGFGAIGWVDDNRKVVARNPRGLSVRVKFFWQSVIGVTAACFLAFYTSLPAQTAFIVPFFKQVTYPLGALGFIVMTYFVIVRSEEHTSELQSPAMISYAVFCLKKGTMNAVCCGRFV